MDSLKYRSGLRSIIAVVVGATIVFIARGEALAAEPDSPAIVPFSEFVKSLSIAPADAYVGQSGMAVKSTAAFGDMRQHLVKMYSGVTVAHSLSRDKEVFDCVSINDQPGVRVRKLKRVAKPPPIPPTSLWGQGQESSSRSVREMDTAGGLEAFGRGCEDGTIPMRRLTLAELTRFATLKDYFAKGPQGTGRVSRDRGSIPPAFNGHSYAHAYQDVTNYGGYSRLGLWRPFVDTSRSQVFSLSQQWYVGGSGAQLQTAEVGWQNYPAKYGSQNSALFIYWTANNYNGTGCYNLDCAAFVQINSNWPLGGTFANYSTVGGPQYEVALGFYLYQGNWWLQAGNDWVGYYPGNLYSGGQLTRYAQRIDYGGETVGTTSWPPMGSGQFASAGWPNAAFHRTILYRDSANTGYDASLIPSQPFPACYTTAGSFWGGADWRNYFFFGGPGGLNC